MRRAARVTGRARWLGPAVACLPALWACVGSGVSGPPAPAREREASGEHPGRRAAVPGGGAADPAARFGDRVLGYPGPGREAPDPEGVEEVLLGWFGPSDPRHPLAGGTWTAAALAVEEANRRGGYRGVPFRLVPRWSESPWSAGASLAARLAYEDRVWAIVGSVDGASTHLAEQVAAKARVALVSPASTDPSVNLAGVPWMFSCAPGDDLWAARLVEDLKAGAGREGRIVVLRATDHDSRLAAAEVLAALARRQRVPERLLDFHPGAVDLARLLEAAGDLEPQVVVIAAGAEDSARALGVVRRRWRAAAVYGTPQMGRRVFLDLAGPGAEGVRFPLLGSPPERPAGATAAAGDFAREFRERAGVEPDGAARLTYDAVSLCVAAVRKAGLNRARIRDALASLSPWRGASGTIRFDGTGRNRAPVLWMAEVRGGRVIAARSAPSTARKSSRPQPAHGRR